MRVECGGNCANAAVTVGPGNARVQRTLRDGRAEREEGCSGDEEAMSIWALHRGFTINPPTPLLDSDAKLQANSSPPVHSTAELFD